MRYSPYFSSFWGYYYRLMDFYWFNVLSNIQQQCHLILLNAQNCNCFGLKLAFKFFHHGFIMGLLRKNFHREEKETRSLKLKNLVRWISSKENKQLTNLCLWRKSQQNTTSFHGKSLEHIGRNIISALQRLYMTDA